jgi:hypothetical protein
LALYPTVKKSTENQEFKLILANYKAGEHDFSDRVKQYFRYVPDYQKNVEIKEIYRIDELQLFRIDDLFISVPSWGYFVYESGTVTELKHRNVLWNKIQELNLTDEEIIKNYNYYELTVDLEQFNKVFSELPREDQMIRFCELFYSSSSAETYELVTSQNQIDQILADWPKSNWMLFEDEPIIDNFDFLDSLRTNQQALWTFDMGLNVFTFTFDETNNLTNCNIELKGNLGNEVVHL